MCNKSKTTLINKSKKTFFGVIGFIFNLRQQTEH